MNFRTRKFGSVSVHTATVSGGGGGNVVTFDAKSSTDSIASAVTSISSTGLTIGTGNSNYALVVQLMLAFANGSPPSSPSVTWNGTTMSLLASGTSPNGVGHACIATLWGLLSPGSGNQTISATWTGTATDAFLYGESFYNVSAFQNASSATGNSSTPTVVVTTTTNDAVVDSMAHLVTYSSNNLTLLFQDDVNGIAGSVGAQYAISATSSIAPSWGLIGTSPWVDVAVDLAHT